MTHQPTPAEQLMLDAAFRRAAADGYGFYDGHTFEAMPGMEDAAADHLQTIIDRMLP